MNRDYNGGAMAPHLGQMYQYQQQPQQQVVEKVTLADALSNVGKYQFCQSSITGQSFRSEMT